MKNKNHLSVFGIGPLYVTLSILITLICFLLNKFNLIPTYHLYKTSIFLKILAFIFFVIAITLWSSAVLFQKIDKHIINNELVTSGAYAWVRNPIYSAIMFVMWGLLCLMNNLYLFLVFPIYIIIMTVLLKCTEEKWLLKQYGQKYTDYCEKVNRCMPWFPQK